MSLKNKMLIAYYGIFSLIMFCILLILFQMIYRMNAPTPKELKKFINVHNIYANYYVNYPIIFNFDDLGINGRCYHIKKVPMFITINSRNWGFLSKHKRIMLILHEIGHCTYNLEHNDAVFDNGCAKSLMNSYMPSDFCVRSVGYKYYVDKFYKEVMKVTR